ncbi:hypothetical protein Srot_0740 [Segniliparus rotundus DSM 44985]|uniref:Uncharacterized protein n=1 Tax=Segniliparus rotundus (strain ATCC BAA-972 / CDC 1076 / CIP 108378 / DSM 44985 / JCM 13578) TaxID=640132 RepID=D6ZDF6_SEGRD|nr:hypothetical protein [Segniliparus rotundus]ADG97220.1 hypothetical protein Srot_0740 [Segniliparus rotundus DSM 44985]
MSGGRGGQQMVVFGAAAQAQAAEQALQASSGRSQIFCVPQWRARAVAKIRAGGTRPQRNIGYPYFCLGSLPGPDITTREIELMNMPRQLTSPGVLRRGAACDEKSRPHLAWSARSGGKHRAWEAM